MTFNPRKEGRKMKVILKTPMSVRVVGLLGTDWPHVTIPPGKYEVEEMNNPGAGTPTSVKWWVTTVQIKGKKKPMKVGTSIPVWEMHCNGRSQGHDGSGTLFGRWPE